MKLYAVHTPGVFFTNQHCYACEDFEKLPEAARQNPYLKEEPYLGYEEDRGITADVDRDGYTMFDRKSLHVMRNGLKFWAYDPIE